ncbi:hypothetical protein RDI58_001501 [Solanum bulbocastanum]|uniref:Uncharacterized protein n=1 Tax=Solanum bulbocastanum TaxID=147425 RepID=A0AAN8YTC7_SOLBU
MEKLRHVDIRTAEFDLEEDNKGISSKLENLRILKNIIKFPIEEVDRMDVLSRRFPNLQQLLIEFQLAVDYDDFADSFCLTLENFTQFQILRLSFKWRYIDIVSRLQLPSNIKKLVLGGTPTQKPVPLHCGTTKPGVSSIKRCVFYSIRRVVLWRYHVP